MSGPSIAAFVLPVTLSNPLPFVSLFSYASSQKHTDESATARYRRWAVTLLSICFHTPATLFAAARF
jgi:hypothetical protein